MLWMVNVRGERDHRVGCTLPSLLIRISWFPEAYVNLLDVVVLYAPISQISLTVEGDSPLRIP